MENKIKDALIENTQWSGSPEKMWETIVTELKPSTPWWKQKKSWLPPVAAAIIILAFLFNSYAPNQPELYLVPDPAPQNSMIFRTLLIEEQLAEVVLLPPVSVSPQDSITLNVELLPMVEELIISAKPPTIQLLNIGGEFGIISETKVESWANQPLIPEQSLIAQVPMKAPAEPGEYLLEMEIEALHNGEIVYINQQQILQVK